MPQRRVSQSGPRPREVPVPALDAPPAPLVEIYVRSLAGEEVPMMVALSASVSELRRQVCAARGAPYWRTQLALGPQVLAEDFATLGEAGVCAGAVVDAVITNPSPEDFNALYHNADGYLNGYEGHLYFRSGFARLSEEDKVSVLQALGCDERVRKLTMEGIGLTDRDAATLAHVVQHSSLVGVLNLSDNDIREQGASRLAETFERNPAVRELYLFRNEISSLGRQRLFEAKMAARQQDGRSLVILCYDV